MKKSDFFKYGIITVLSAFALLTLFLSSSVLFDWFGIRAKEGNYVPFIVGTNFLCSILYLTAAYGFIGLFVHITMDGLYETKTVGAMVFRIVLTLGFLVLAKKITNK